MVSAITIEAINANVLVNASGLNSFPSAPIIVKTGKKLTTVVATAVITALPTSLAARCTTSSLDASDGAFSR